MTGGAGFVGSHLCERLAQNPSYQVYPLDNYFSGSESNHVENVEYIRGDIENIERLVQFNVHTLYHLGEYSRVEQSSDDIDRVWRSNEDGMYMALKKLLRANTPHS